MPTILDLMEYSSDMLAQAAYVTSLAYDTNLQLWSKLESGDDVTSPQKGYGGSVIGSPTYPSAKFGNGILSNINGEYCKFPTAGNNINIDKGTIEFWAKLNFGPADPDHHHMFTFTDYPNGGIRFRFVEQIDDFQCWVYSGGSVVAQLVTVGLTWNPGDILHFAVVWDRTGNDIGNGDTVRIYINNVNRAASASTWAADTVNADLFIGVDTDGTMHSDAVIDNIKTYNYCKTDFSNRNTEGTAEGIQCYSESSIKEQGNYSIKAIAGQTYSLNQTLTRTIGSPINILNKDRIKFSIRASRTGSNIKIGIRDSGGNTSEHTPVIQSANSWQTEKWGLQRIIRANRDAIDRIIFTILNADSENTFYIDNMQAYCLGSAVNVL